MNRLTEQQTRAVGARGRVIVSASAGSGKTFVMIERLVSLILEGADVRNVLAVTFTNKAAAQMRDRLRAALLKRIAESGDSERARLKEQLHALPLADISTIHAWCARLVRSHFYLADVDPSFRIISPDDAEGKLLSSRALDEVFDAAYEEGGADFYRLLSVFFRKKKDLRLRETVRSLLTAMRGRADYRVTLQNMGMGDDFEEICAYLAEDFRMRASLFGRQAEELSAFFAGQKGKGAALAAGIAAAAHAVENADGLFAMTELPAPVLPSTPPSTKAEGEERRKLKRLSALSAAVKDLYKEFKVYASREEEYARYLDGQSVSRALAGLVLRYDECYARLKAEAGVLDYDDLEHCALKVLENGEAQRAVREKYRYLFVDEYQDVNPAQERILSLVGGEEIFLVGDPKQSIYGFRGSRSEYFTGKTKEFPVSLELTENFRSAPAVLEAVNRVFSRAMTEETGAAYGSPMRGGSRYGSHGGIVRFHIAEEEPAEKAERGVYSVLKDVLPETDALAEKVADLVEENFGAEWFDADAGIAKRVGFGDIAVLVRKNTGDAERIVSALSARDIPVTTTSGVNVCEFWEGRLVIDFLSYLDNPEQDIPLAGALLSRIGGFTDAELCEIRQKTRSYSFRGACREYARDAGEGRSEEIVRKLGAFAENTARYRALMRVKTAAEMIDLLLSEGLEAEIAAKRDGEARLRRVRRLRAEGGGTVNEFLRRLKALGGKVEFKEGGGEGAVKVLTMHASKGLEYPVVILGSLDVPFHTERDEVLVTDRFGFAPKSYDVARKVARDTVLRRASAVFSDREERKGELNLLYVAMTRAEYRLDMVFGGEHTALSPMLANRFSSWIDFSDCADYFAGGEESAALPPSRTAPVYRPDGALLQALREVYRRPYAHGESTRFPVKSSATDLLEERGEQTGVRGGAAVDEGLAYHAFLEHAAFGKGAEEELCRMREEDLLSAEQLALLDRGKLEQMLALPSLSSLAGKRIWRERKFLLSLPAREVPGFSTDEEDEIVFQGAIDLLAEDEEGYLILDYKFSGGDAEYLRSRYAPQLLLYRKAVSRAMGVDEATVRARIVNIKRLFEVEM